MSGLATTTPVLAEEEVKQPNTVTEIEETVNEYTLKSMHLLGA